MYDAVIYVHFLWTAPLTIIAGTNVVGHPAWTLTWPAFSVAVTLLYYYGVAAAAGIAVLALLVPLQMQFTWLAATLRRAMLKSTDHRIMFTTELLSGIRTVKQYDLVAVNRRIRGSYPLQVCLGGPCCEEGCCSSRRRASVAADDAVCQPA